MTVRGLRPLQQGWSLVELAVALVIAALLMVLLITLLPLGNQVLDQDRQQRELAQAEQALLGYARAHAQMPSADSDGDGRANGGANAGWLPVHDLGLSPRMRIRYQVQPHLALPPAELFRPLVSPEFASQLSTSANGLDLCMRLLLDQRGNVPMAGLGMPVSFYLAHSGGRGHDLARGAETWDPTAQALPGDGNSPVLTSAAGPGEFSSRLACPDLLARAQGSAQAALASWSAVRMTEFNYKFRQFDVKIAELTLDQAQTGLAFAAVGLAMAIADEAIAITLVAAGWPPEGFAIGVGIAENIVALASIGFAAYQVAMATDDLKSAEEGVELAKQVEADVGLYLDKVKALHANANRKAITLDNAGLTP
ncbi:hypothetical protein B1992_04640 [Pseudoxanthomonas broegbernensis]|uniref:Prepilin-type N-terminal cleavage/methylation domain-containing protein n=1 Tax=Pseudoxanthomonas broegbernensis TaxID=83619 RepID=A0A7V8GNP8_9GAMM|nr:hypothetical protein [Pseudoxanthomonas broegbernensis]KAF1687273.1 hypothetical protein B1992_04640 [Pseudoxanthomonas broegbernensis]MBB6065734.1 type II secretory pathway pseudopilin PulG [Pseudoxanthomonas broegbernensis]